MNETRGIALRHTAGLTNSDCTACERFNSLKMRNLAGRAPFSDGSSRVPTLVP